MMSAAWEGDRGGSVVARHEWKGLSKIPGALEDWVEKKKLERLEHKATSGCIPGAFGIEDED
jgi:WD repeat-containing protein 23